MTNFNGSINVGLSKSRGLMRHLAQRGLSSNSRNLKFSICFVGSGGWLEIFNLTPLCYLRHWIWCLNFCPWTPCVYAHLKTINRTFQNDWLLFTAYQKFNCIWVSLSHQGYTVNKMADRGDESAPFLLWSQSAGRCSQAVWVISSPGCSDGMVPRQNQDCPQSQEIPTLLQSHLSCASCWRAPVNQQNMMHDTDPQRIFGYTLTLFCCKKLTILHNFFIRH